MYSILAYGKEAATEIGQGRKCEKEADDSKFCTCVFQLNVVCCFLTLRLATSFSAKRAEGKKVWRRGNEKSLRQSVTVHLLCLIYLVAVTV